MLYVDQSMRFAASEISVYRLISLLLLCLLTSCAGMPYGPYTVAPNPLGEVTEWTTRLFPEPGQIRINLQLQHGATTTISLQKESEHDDEIPVRVVFSDEGCDAGHQVRVTYFGNSREIYHKYFDTTISWDNESTVTIEWGNDGKVSVRVNGETLIASSDQKFSLAHISSVKGYVKIKDLQYNRLQKISQTTIPRNI